MKEANYPVDYGTFEELSDFAKTVVHYENLSCKHRFDLRKYEDESWRTFRDYEDGSEFKSLFTGRASVSLKKKWLDINDCVAMK